MEWRSGNAGYTCVHLQSVPYSVPAEECHLRLKCLEQMIKDGFQRPCRKSDCEGLLIRAKQELTPLLVRMPNDGFSSERLAFFSVFTDHESFWCKSGRTVVTLDTKTSELCCKCRQKGCKHRSVVKWWLYQEGKCNIIPNLNEVNKVEQNEENPALNSLYPPSGEKLIKMVQYIQKEKEIPDTLTGEEFDEQMIPRDLIPTETICTHCDIPLSEPIEISRRAEIVCENKRPLVGNNYNLVCHIAMKRYVYNYMMWNFYTSKENAIIGSLNFCRIEKSLKLSLVDIITYLICKNLSLIFNFSKIAYHARN